MTTAGAELFARLARVNAARAAADADRRAAAWLADEERRLDGEFGCGRALAVYGTLVPGGSNHVQVAHLGGAWSAGAVRGRRGVRAFPVFTWDPEAPPVPVMVLVADGLRAHWPRLDAFEGRDYRRILVPVEDCALAAVANLYAAVVRVGLTR